MDLKWQRIALNMIVAFNIYKYRVYLFRCGSNEKIKKITISHIPVTSTPYKMSTQHAELQTKLT